MTKKNINMFCFYCNYENNVLAKETEWNSEKIIGYYFKRRDEKQFKRIRFVQGEKINLPYQDYAKGEDISDAWFNVRKKNACLV